MPPTLKVAQYNKRRYALRLEPIFWQGLEKIATQKGWPLGRVIAEAAEAEHGINLSSYLRAVVTHMWQEEATQQQLTTTPNNNDTSLWDIAEHCPTPACLITDTRHIVLTNTALNQWLGINTNIKGALFEQVFTPKLTRSLAETLVLMGRGKLLKTQFQVTHIDNVGHTRTAMATLQAVPQHGRLFGLVWLHSAAPLQFKQLT